MDDRRLLVQAAQGSGPRHQIIVDDQGGPHMYKYAQFVCIPQNDIPDVVFCRGFRGVRVFGVVRFRTTVAFRARGLGALMVVGPAESAGALPFELAP
jgi:hypothetical protein